MACTQRNTKGHTSKEEISLKDVVVGKTAMVEVGVNAKADTTQRAIGLIHLTVSVESSAEPGRKATAEFHASLYLDGRVSF